MKPKDLRKMVLKFPQMVNVFMNSGEAKREWDAWVTNGLCAGTPSGQLLGSKALFEEWLNARRVEVVHECTLRDL